MAKRKVLHRQENGSDMNIVGLDRFFTRQNVALYRTLADKRTNAAKRKEILQLLAEEQIKFRSDFARPAAHANQVWLVLMMIMPPTALEGDWTVSKHGNRMDLKVVAILSLVGVAIWLSHIAAKKREKIHKWVDSTFAPDVVLVSNDFVAGDLKLSPLPMTTFEPLRCRPEAWGWQW
jgi:hypothetical protein